MESKLSFIERQLLERFKACDQRGKNQILEAAKIQMELSVKDSMQLASAARECLFQERTGIQKLKSEMERMSATRLGVLEGAATATVGRYPRFEMNISVDADNLSALALASLRAAEQCNDDGLNLILELAGDLASKYPKHCKAQIINIKR